MMVVGENREKLELSYTAGEIRRGAAAVKQFDSFSKCCCMTGEHLNIRT